MRFVLRSQDAKWWRRCRVVTEPGPCPLRDRGIARQMPPLAAMPIEPSGKSDAALIGSHRGSRLTVDGFHGVPQLANIHALGVRHIVNLNLHTHEKALPDEAASVSRLGMTYPRPG